MGSFSLAVSILALVISWYFSYRPFKERRNSLKHKLILYRGIFDQMAKEWKFHQEWFDSLDEKEENKYIHFYITLPTDFFRTYPLTDQDTNILSSLGFYKQGFGIEDSKAMSFLKIKYMIVDFLADNDKGTGFIQYEFASLQLAKHYINQNSISDFQLSKFISGILTNAISKL